MACNHSKRKTVISMKISDKNYPVTDTVENIVEVLYCPSCGKGCLQFSNDLMIELWQWFEAKLNIFEDSK